MKIPLARHLSSGLLSYTLVATLTCGCLEIAKATSLPEAQVAKPQSPVSDPREAAIFHARVFEQPLVRIGGETSPEENSALLTAIDAYRARDKRDDDQTIREFLGSYPNSPWRIALLTNLGLEYRHTGWFLKAMDAWEEAWRLGRDATSLEAKLVVDRAVTELLELNARVGRRARVEALLEEIKDRPLIGSATEKVAGAREGAWLMRNEPGKAFRCGPLALDRIRAFENPASAHSQQILDARSSKNGMSLDQIETLARDLQMDYVMARREPGAKVIVPSVVNWKAEHYAAIVREEAGRFLIQDPTFGDDMWVSQAALDAESSGYFLVPRAKLPSGWQLASAREAAHVWGRGNTQTHDISGTKPYDEKAKKCGSSTGMAVYNFHLQTVSLNLTDTPVGYTPSIGRAIHFTASYNHREAERVGLEGYSNLGQKWTFDWFSYIQDDSFNAASECEALRRRRWV